MGGGGGNEGRILWGGRGGVEDSFNGHSLSGEEGSQERGEREKGWKGRER